MGEDVLVMNEKVFMNIKFDKSKITAENVEKWFRNMLLFKPHKMNGKRLTNHKTRKYVEGKFYSGIANEVVGDDRFGLELFSEDRKSMLMLTRTPLHASITITAEKHLAESVIKIANEFFVNYGGIVGYVCSGKDKFFQNLDQAYYFEAYGVSLEGIPLKERKSNLDPLYVDTEYFPGHSHYGLDLWFGSCWMMWYGKEYFKYIPKEVLKGFSDCYEKIELEDGSIRIVLHENIWDYDLPENRERQWAFRKFAGVDKVAHCLEKEPIRVQNPDPAVEFIYGSFEHGGNKLVKMYYDKKKQSIERSKAVYCTVSEYGENGLIWSDVIELTKSN